MTIDRKKTDKKEKKLKAMAETSPITILVQRRWRSATRRCSIATSVYPEKMAGFIGN